jgi:hypothetical protein
MPSAGQTSAVDPRNSTRSVNKATYVPLRTSASPIQPSRLVEKVAFLRGLGITEAELTSIRTRLVAGSAPTNRRRSRSKFTLLLDAVGAVSAQFSPNSLIENGGLLAQTPPSELATLASAVSALRQQAAAEAAQKMLSIQRAYAANPGSVSADTTNYRLAALRWAAASGSQDFIDLQALASLRASATVGPTTKNPVLDVSCFLSSISDLRRSKL